MSRERARIQAPKSGGAIDVLGDLLDIGSAVLEA